MAPRFDRDPAASGPIVKGFAAGGFAVDGGVYRALLLTPDSAREWAPPALDALTIEDLADLLAIDPAPEFLILGTGRAMAFPPRALVRALEARSVGLEAMDSRAAARTWGMLRAEERWIAAAIMPMEPAPLP
ncbi:MAG TPA: Mth938-like domain-containing protein [Allosphingosinicella sp.]|jgi:uncharacterized protein